MAGPITRVTMIKIPVEEHLKIALEGFEQFTKDQKKDGAPYILSMEAGPVVFPTEKSQGYTFVTKSVFKSKEDIDFYEQKCEGHLKYKAFLKENKVQIDGMLAVCFTVGASFAI